MSTRKTRIEANYPYEIGELIAYSTQDPSQ